MVDQKTRLHRKVACTGFVLAMILLVGSPSAFAQGLAGVTGSVSDPTDAVIPGVEVTVTNAATGASRSVITNESGGRHCKRGSGEHGRCQAGRRL